MEEYTRELEALEARRKSATERLAVATDLDERRRLQDELAQIDEAVEALGEEDA